MAATNVNATTTSRPANAIQIRKASDGEVPGIADTLARAFFDDPVFRWTFPDDERRRAVLPEIFSNFTEAFAPYGETYLGGDASGAALWAPPGRAPLSDEFNERLARAAGGEERFFEIAQLFEERHPAGSYYYLQFLGVEPERQGRGIGSAMLDHVLQRCDHQGAGAYLDATSPPQQAALRATRLCRHWRVRARGRAPDLADVARAHRLIVGSARAPRHRRMNAAARYQDRARGRPSNRTHLVAVAV
jgi:ribosomal protein S18 acetylase RimI-like enzyme